MPESLIHFSEKTASPGLAVVKKHRKYTREQFDIQIDSSNNFQELVEIKKNTAYVYNNSYAKAAFVPDLGARVFCELNGQSLHRLDIDNVKKPNKPFNNYGGNNFWPAPEGGKFGFNYNGNTWQVQTAINNKPFTAKSSLKNSAVFEKQTKLVNRKGTAIDVVMQRAFSLANVPEILNTQNPQACFAYVVEDKIDVLNEVKAEDALLACWTLEQFNASDSTFGFVKVENPEQAINFDFYENPSDKIRYKSNGFIYKTDGKRVGQIGIKKDSKAQFIGFYDLSKKIICIRDIIEQRPDGTYFNIADNDQLDGPFSASDNYSIFNGGLDQGFFELETIGAAIINENCLKGSNLKSRTSFAIFKSSQQIQDVITSLIGN